MDAISATLMIKVLDGLSARAVATAGNVANAGTPNYHPVRVTFEEALKAAAGQGSAAVRAFQPTIGPEIRADLGQGLRLDLELATASSTAGRYAALVEVLNRQLQIDGLAVSGNK